MELPKRKRIRIKDYDYSQNGPYFVTICAYKHEHIFGKIVTPVGQGFYPCRHQNNDYYSSQKSIELSDIGKIIHQEIIKLEKRFENIKITDYIIMPNHIHIIVWINKAQPVFTGNDLRQEKQIRQGQSFVRQGQSPCPTTLGNIVGAFKSISTKRANAFQDIPGRKIWQFRFHDHIIRNQTEYKIISKYIYENPLKWEQDCYYNEV